MKHWTPEDRIEGRTLAEHVTMLFVELRLNPRQRALLVTELREMLGPALIEVESIGLDIAAMCIERVLALVDELSHNGRQNAYLGSPTRTNVMRSVLRERGEAWTSWPELSALALPKCIDGTTNADLNGSFRSMLNTGEVVDDGGPKGRRRYRLAKGAP